MYTRQISEREQFEQNWAGYQAALKGYDSAQQGYQAALKDYNSAQQDYNSAQQVHDTAVRAEQAADKKIANADANLSSITEKKRVMIIKKLDTDNAKLRTKFNLLSNSNDEITKTKLDNLIARNDKLKSEAQSAISLEEVSKKFRSAVEEGQILLA